MGKIMAELKGKADGKEINTVVTELLNAIHWKLFATRDT
jgi:hypothetical protein